MNLLAMIFLLLGAIVVLFGSIGLIRLPDFFCRMHGAGIVDTLGAWLILAGLLLLSDNAIDAFKVFMIAVLFYFLAPVVSHVIARAAVKAQADGERPDSTASK